MAVAPDESKVAIVGRNQQLGGLLMFDMTTHTFSLVSGAGEIAHASSISWAPNGPRIVFQTDRYDQPSVISVVDLSTGRVQQIAEGTHPAWSPTGEWITYIDEAEMTCWLVHPDGTGARVLERLHDDWLHVLLLGYHRFLYGEVWSADGSEVLLNEENADGPSVRVMRVDVVTGRSVRMSRNGVPVFGWARDDPR